jgi:hypothetical protein
VPLVHTHAVKPAFGAEFWLQATHTFVCVPVAEYVPAPQLVTTASAVEVQIAATR